MVKLPAWAWGLAGLGLGYVLFGHGRPPTIPAGTQHTMDSLAATDSAHRAFAEAAADTVRAFRDSTAILLHRQLQTQQRVSQQQRRADSLATLALVADSSGDGQAATYWHGAYLAEHERGDTLQSLADRNFQTMRGAMATANLCLKAQIEADGRLSQMQGVNQDLQSVIAKARKPSAFSLGLSAGYGLMATGGEVRTGPVIAVGLNLKIPTPHLF